MKAFLLFTLSITLFSLNAEALTSLTPKKTEMECISFTKNLQVGSSTDAVVRKEVRLLQTFLGVNGYLKALPTGTFGQATTEALKAYQKRESIKLTGMLDKATKESIAKKNCGDTLRPRPELVISPTKASIDVGVLDDTSSSFSWSFKGKVYELKVPMSQRLHSYYKQSQKVYTYKGDLPDNWTEDYNRLFLKVRADDTTFDTLTLALLELARQENLSSDDTASLIISFVQSIPYDFAKDTKKEQTQYPYETLFTKKGVCADKTFLMYHLLRRAGYGVAIMQFLEKNHQALGIKCPKSTEVFGSGYCYVETTAVLPVGIIPTSFGQNGQGINNLSEGKPEFDLLLDTTRLGKADIFLKTEGRSYLDVEDLKVKLERLTVLLKEIQESKEMVASSTEDLNRRKENLKIQKELIDKLAKEKNFEEFTKNRTDYNTKVTELQLAFTVYEEIAKTYNNNVKEYNKLLLVLDHARRP
jgi:hypothetical protein